MRQSMDLIKIITDRGQASNIVAQNSDIRIWQCNGLFQHDLRIDELNRSLSTIEVIDQYAGSVPELFSQRRTKLGSIQLKLYRTLLLDSNVARFLRQFIAGSLNDKLYSEMKDLVTWIAEENLNVHPGFSLMETISGSDNPDFDGTELIKMALLFGGLDSNHFLSTGNLRMSQAGTDYLIAKFGTSDIERAATLEYSRLPKKTRDIVAPSYAALLKIAEIEATIPHSQFAKRIDTFMDFLENKLFKVGPVEIVVALLFFSGKIGAFIPFRRKTPISQRFEDVWSSAWDLYLARMAPAFIGQGDETTLTLPLIITGDNRLRQIVRAQELVGVVRVQQDAPKPIVLTDFNYLRSFTPKLWDDTALQDRLKSRVPNVMAAQNVDIYSVIANLECDLRRLFFES
jgi:hypothetical protein